MKKLDRSLSLPYVIAISIGGMLGSGIFVLPGFASGITGSSVWLAYLLGALCVFKCELSNLLFQALYKSPSFGCCHLSHVVFLKLRKKEQLAKLSKFTK